MTMPSQAELEEYQADIEELTAVAAAEVAAIVMALSGEEDSGDQMAVAIPAALEQYMSAATEIAMSWYRGLARTEPRSPEVIPGAPAPFVGATDRVSLLAAQEFEPRPAELPPREQLESTVWWALYEPPAPEEPDSDATPAESLEPTQSRDAESERASTAERAVPVEDEPRARIVAAEESTARATVTSRREGEDSLAARVVPPTASEQEARAIARLAGAVQRYVATAARDTVTENADAEDVMWVRHARPDACAFCRLLATRGPVYLSEESAVRVVGRRGRPRGSRAIGEKYHDFCYCEPVPIRAGDSYSPPEYVAAWETQYGKAVAEVGNASDTKRILAEMRRLERLDGGSSH